MVPNETKNFYAMSTKSSIANANRCCLKVTDAFKRIDANGDGKLTKREMLAGEEFTMEEVKLAFKETVCHYAGEVC